MLIRSLKIASLLIVLILISGCQTGADLPVATQTMTVIPNPIASSTATPTNFPTESATTTSTATMAAPPTPWSTATAGPTAVGGSEQIMFSIAMRKGESYQYLGVYNYNRLLSHVDTIFTKGYNLQNVSPDGRWILVNLGSNLFLAGRYGSNPVQLSKYFYNQSVSSAVWSEDGQQIWWIEDEVTSKRVMQANFLGEDIQLAAQELQDQTAQLLQVQDDTIFAWLKGSCNSGNLCQGEVWLRNDRSPGLTNWGKVSNPTFDLNLSKLAFSTQVEAGAALAIKTDSNQAEAILVDMEGNIPVDYAWSPDGNTLIAIDQVRSDYSGKNFGNNVLLLTSPDWKPEIIAQLAGMNARSTWSPDGKWAVFSSTLAADDVYHLQLSILDVAGKNIQELNLPMNTISTDYIFIPRIFWLPG